MSLWTPPTVRPELKDSTAAHNAAMESMLRFNTPVCAEWNRELEKLDSRLRLAKASTDAHAPGVKAGFYHLVMRNPGQPLTVNPLTGRDGEYAEPTSRMLDTLRANDLQNARAALDRARAAERAERDAERDRERDEQARHEELDERWAAVTRTQVSTNQDTPWSQNAAGRRGARRD